MKKNQNKFYDKLMDNSDDFTFFTKDTRYNVLKLLKKREIIKYFDEFIKNYISENDKILDYGCGPGTFSVKLSSMTKNQVYGIDISKKFIEECEILKNTLKIDNFHPQHVEGKKLPYNDNSFDLILLFDVIHHLEDINENFVEIKRVLKKSGKLVIYEPNKLNPLIALMHIIDPIERGLLRVGTKKKYSNILRKYEMSEIEQKYSGIVVGPDSKIFSYLSKVLNYSFMYKIFGWLNPKIVIVAKNNS